MRYAYTELTAPASEPVTLARAKAKLAIDHNDDDDLITGMITSAREYAETHTGRIFGSRSFLLEVDHWPHDREFRFPVVPVTSVTSLKYRDTTETENLFDPAGYTLWLRGDPPILRLNLGWTYPTLSLNNPTGIAIEFVAGEVNPPASLGNAILLFLEYWYENPGGGAPTGNQSRGAPDGAIRLLDSLWTGAL